MNKKEAIRIAAEEDLLFYIKLVAPHRMLGQCHEDVISWWTREDANDHQLVLLPRDHQKSALIAYRVAWEIAKNPAVTVLYISATSNLAEKQLYFIKAILESKVHMYYWPDLINVEEGKRDKWTNGEINVDHPLRKTEGVRDSTVFTAGLTTGITGLHFDIAVLDDVVVKENAFTEEGRNKVREQYSLLSSIEKGGAQEWLVGTRYHPKDLYSELIEMEVDLYNEAGDILDTVSVYEVWQKEVEDRGDGLGEFLWPRQQRPDGKWFGFNNNILAKKKAKYLDKAQFYAQYYNNPNDPTGARISVDKFQYYDKKFLDNVNGTWYYKEERLNVFAAIDFAFSLKKKSDFTALVALGVDRLGNYYVLDISRFKTDRISEYFDEILNMYTKWGFRKIRAEVTVAQKAIVRELKESYIKSHGLALSIDEYHPTRHQGSKEERIAAIIEPRYDNQAVWHYRGGNCQILEEELTLAHPPHDDVKDALAAAMDVAVVPMGWKGRKKESSNVVYHSRFGGVAA